MEKLLNIASYFILRVFIMVSNVIPHTWMHKVIVMLLSLTNYRKKVIKANLKMSGIAENENVIAKLTLDNYRFIADVICETLFSKPYTLKFSNLELLDTHAGTDGTIILMGHVNNWEIIGKKIGDHAKRHGWGIYKPIKNKLVDEYMFQKRSGQYSHPLAMNKLYRKILEERKANNQALYLLIADQSPASKNNAILTDFFSVPTYFLNGAEKLNEKFDFGFVYLDCLKTQSGYNVTVKPLDKDHQITEQYAKLLEDNIRQNPSRWLWSHRRWKLS